MWKDAEDFLVKDKHLGLLVKKYGPCKIKPSRAEDYFEDLVSAIVGQQLSGKAAQTIFGRLKSGIGDTNTALSPTAILKISDDNFRNWGLSGAKTIYVKDLAGKVDGGQLVLDDLNNMTDTEISAELIKVKGIGPWTAQMFLMFSLGRPDVFPVLDLGIRKGVEKLLGKPLKAQEMELFAARWKPHRTVASWYVWKVTDGENFLAA